MTVTSYRDLKVWNKAMDLVVDVYIVSEKLPDRERFGLTNMARRCAISIPTKIATGQGRHDTDAYVRDLYTARSAIQELETELLLTVRLGYCEEKIVDGVLASTAEISRMLSGLVRSLNSGSDS